MLHLENTTLHNQPSMYIEELKLDNDLYTQREIMADPFDETQGPGTIFGSPPCDHLKFAVPHGSACPCLSSAMVPPLLCTFVALIVDPYPVPFTVHSTHKPNAAQCVLALVFKSQVIPTGKKLKPDQI